jgi:hypothetical protein
MMRTETMSNHWTNAAIRLTDKVNAQRRTAARKAVHVSSSVSVTETEGVEKPKLIGESGGHFTNSGDRIAYPGAYSKRGWSNMYYSCSTQKVLVPVGYFAS